MFLKRETRYRFFQNKCILEMVKIVRNPLTLKRACIVHILREKLCKVVINVNGISELPSNVLRLIYLVTRRTVASVEKGEGNRRGNTITCILRNFEHMLCNLDIAQKMHLERPKILQSDLINCNRTLLQTLLVKFVNCYSCVQSSSSGELQRVGGPNLNKHQMLFGLYLTGVGERENCSGLKTIMLKMLYTRLSEYSEENDIERRKMTFNIYKQIMHRLGHDVGDAVPSYVTGATS